MAWCRFCFFFCSFWQLSTLFGLFLQKKISQTLLDVASWKFFKNNSNFCHFETPVKMSQIRIGQKIEKRTEEKEPPENNLAKPFFPSSTLSFSSLCSLGPNFGFIFKNFCTTFFFRFWSFLKISVLTIFRKTFKLLHLWKIKLVYLYLIRWWWFFFVVLKTDFFYIVDNEEKLVIWKILLFKMLYVLIIFLW